MKGGEKGFIDSHLEGKGGDGTHAGEDGRGEFAIEERRGRLLLKEKKGPGRQRYDRGERGGPIFFIRNRGKVLCQKRGELVGKLSWNSNGGGVSVFGEKKKKKGPVLFFETNP